MPPSSNFHKTPSRSGPMKRRYFTIPLLLLVIGFIIFVQSASKRIVSPNRAKLRDAQQAILAEPETHGMKILSDTATDGTPYLLCEGLHVTGKKGRILRTQLSKRGCHPTREHPVLLLLHGHASRKENQLAIAERFCAAGFTCLIPDLPGHGKHPEKIGTFGKTEVPLLLNLVKEARKEHHLSDKVSLFGLSQGGAVALQLAAADEQQFHAVVTISTFANLSKTLSQTAENKSPVLGALFPIVKLNIGWRHDFDLKKISPAQAAKTLSLPVFIAHGLDDTFIPPANAEIIFNNLSHPSKRLRLVPEAGHANVLAKGELIYADLCEFLLEATSDS